MRAGATHLLPLLALTALLGACPKQGRGGASAPDAAASPAIEEPPERPERRLFVVTGGLERVLERGVLRILVFGDPEAFLPRRGPGTSRDRELSQRFAASLGVKAELIRVERFSELLSFLREGKGDLVAARLTVTPSRAEEVAFTRPTHVVDELVVARRGAACPKRVEDLAGKEVHVWKSSAYAESLEAEKARAPGLRIVPVDDRLDDEQVVHLVGEGEIPLTVVDSDLFEAIRAYNDDVVACFPLRRGRKIAWAVRQENPRLKAKADAFLIAEALTGHTKEVFQGDLDGILARGVLRVLTRNNATSYFLYRGRQLGFDYELMALFAKELGVRLEMVVPPRSDQLIPWLLEGRGDVIAAAYTVTPERAEQVAFSLPYLFVDEVLVQRKGAKRPRSVEELAGKTIHVRPSSSYARTLAALKEKVPLKIAPADEGLETEELIAKVAKGEIEHTVADEHILKVERTFRDDVEPALRLTRAQEGAKDPIGKPRKGAKEIAFAVRKTSQALKARLDAFVKRTYRGLEYNLARRRYFEEKRSIARTKTERFSASGRLSPYDEVIQKHAARYGLDWRLLAAQAYQESRFDPKARSWVGARGLFQVMPQTGAELGFHDLEDVEQGTHAGVKYLAQLIERFEPTLDFRQRVRFALASYNAGYGHVLDARRLAKALGKDPDRWFGNVEEAMLLLQDPRYYRQARYGYCRGEEPVRYVSEIQARYDDYVKLVPP